MRVAFDTSVLVSALFEAHPHHQRAQPWLQAVAEGTLEGIFSRHALAETWSVLTRLPLRPRLSGREALQVLERLRENGFTPVDLTAEIYEVALRRCVDTGFTSGAVFDALHLAAAEAAGADLVLTFNVKHFSPLSGEGSPLVLAPPDPPSLEVKEVPRRQVSP
ncbi:MAG: type II toxin-antitoxin system VapC family toxin [bacterium]|nr:type II toxin-antitoxin system VapC family toxin [bacterium]